MDKKFMTWCQLSEWLAKGNGEFKTTQLAIRNRISYSDENSDEEIPDDIGAYIRYYRSDCWMYPTIDIYVKDCCEKNKDKETKGQRVTKNDFKKECVYCCGEDELVGKLAYMGDNIDNLYDCVVNKKLDYVSEIEGVFDKVNSAYPFISSKRNKKYRFVYYDPDLPELQDDKKEYKLMTHSQLSEWLAKGFGYSMIYGQVFTVHRYQIEEEGSIDDAYQIRRWGSDKWIKPTVDVYNEDCK